MKTHLLTYTPPLDRILREPFVNAPSGEDDEYLHHWIQWVAYHNWPPLRRFPRFSDRPVVCVNTCPEPWARNCEAWDAHSTHIVFHDRESYRAAWQIARCIASHHDIPSGLIELVDWVEFSFFHAHLAPREVIAV